MQLGTAVIVLPWHDPVEIAEKIALLDVVSGGRTIFGFGRGAATVEYNGFRINMEEARDRFVESAIIIRKGLTQKSFSFDGKYYKIPEIQIRPRPISHPEDRFYASSVSPESAEIMAKLGLGRTDYRATKLGGYGGGLCAVSGDRGRQQPHSAPADRIAQYPGFRGRS